MKAALLALALLLPGGSGCGGSARCGDGVRQPENDEQCDDGNDVDTDACHNDCTANLAPLFTIQWAFDKDEVSGFTGDNCTDMGVTDVRVDLTGQQSASLTTACPQRQAVFEDLPSGTYLVEVTPLDINGNAKV
ncbi:MAG TPA: hypothetical protein VL172_13285, partial [Kofleriaceae bacterium]|nr:hypothetical protein [Kofleriaceae bacterium]